MEQSTKMNVKFTKEESDEFYREFAKRVVAFEDGELAEMIEMFRTGLHKASWTGDERVLNVLEALDKVEIEIEWLRRAFGF
ncbi:hypothetical protein K1728_05495 [Weissella confusa]|uniref:hypothetical protein n=1 Tax=Weissella confusa TaxID=1583 RepID=UPI001C6FC13F|nr:hypothetical protein [Weissella confusa]QYU58853.1 hypothetical protein K1728_05495 [Weissella confusa]